MQNAGRELLLLGMLRRTPLSAYGIDQAIHAHTPLYRPLRFGNVYHLLEKLTRAGYLLRRDAKASRGPSQTKAILHLSAKGEARFHELLRSVVCDVQAQDSALEIAIVLLGQLPRSSAITLLVERRDELARQERRLKRLFGDMNARSGPGYMAGTHAFSRVASELDFIRDMLALLRNARWRSEWE